MTEEQKSFKILKRVSYEEQISEEERKAILNIVKIGVCGVVA